MQRGMDQARLSEAYGDFVGKFNLPQQLLSQYSGIMAGITPHLGTITQVFSEPRDTGTDLSDLIGLGAALRG